MLRVVFAVLAMACLAGPTWALPASSHDYGFVGTLADSDGGPALVAIAGGTLGTAADPGFTFGTDQGLQLTGGVSPFGPWSIEIQFYYNGDGRYEKIIDFSALVSDNGLYTNYDALSLYPSAHAATAQLNPGVPNDLVLTRSGAGAVVAYVNGVQSFSYDDSQSGLTALGANPLTFFADDAATHGTEDAPGVVQRIRTFDTVLTQADAAALASGAVPPSSAPALPPGPIAVPEPATLWLLVVVTAGWALVRGSTHPAPMRAAIRRCGARRRWISCGSA